MPFPVTITERKQQHEKKDAGGDDDDSDVEKQKPKDAERRSQKKRFSRCCFCVSGDVFLGEFRCIAVTRYRRIRYCHGGVSSNQARLISGQSDGGTGRDGGGFAGGEWSQGLSWRKKRNLPARLIRDGTIRGALRFHGVTDDTSVQQGACRLIMHDGDDKDVCS